MKLDDILAIGGKPGLFKLVKATRQGVLVESLLDQKRMPVSQRADVSALSDIAIYTYEEELPLGEVYDRLFEKLEGAKALDVKKASGDDLREFMSSFLPDYDEERVYTSHLKKLFSWYNLLHECDLLNRPDDKAAEAPAEESSEESE
ncbi:DUF5606 domain-containing protein [Croceimicrobium sp.]|uniref:DUF5606 family protein n=1 Tax=Croceimicrobium sp. TaxID=2828340 RepID=UPI003BAA6377